MKQSMKLVTFGLADGTSKSKTYADIYPRLAASLNEKLGAVKYIGQRLAALSTRTYSETDYIQTYNTDTEVSG